MTWACERFQDYLIGTQFRVETDHKPLVLLLSSKALDAVPVRVQRFRLRLMRFRYSISHVPGRELNTADTLSRAPVSEVDGRDDDFHKEVNVFVNFVVRNLPATEERLQVIRNQQDEDSVCRQLKVCCKVI